MNKIHGVTAKFSPPVVDDLVSLNRVRLIGEVLEKLRTGTSKIHIEAQAGQGKTIFAAQLARSIAAPVSWYQIDASDEDPVRFARSLHNCFSQAFPAFSAPSFERKMSNGDHTPKEIAQMADLIVSATKKSVPEGSVLFFDDVHHLSPESLGNHFLTTLINGLDHSVNVCLASRHPICEDLPNLTGKRSSFLVGNDKLAFTLAECGELLNGRMQLPVKRETVSKVWKATEGWVMGIILAAQSLADEDFDKDPQTEGLKPADFKDYFTKNVMEKLPREVSTALMALSLPDEVPLELAHHLLGEDRGAESLTTFAKKNYFLRLMDGERKVFVFHHLFQETLRELAREKFGQDRISELNTKTAEWLERNGNTENAMRHYLLAENYGEADRLISMIGPELEAENETVLLGGILSDLPAKPLTELPWLAYFNGVTLMDKRPGEALESFTNARKIFFEKGIARGELLTLSKIIQLIQYFNPDYKALALPLKRAEELMEKEHEDLPPPLRIQLMCAIAGGLVMTSRSSDKIDKYTKRALHEARVTDVDNLLALATVSRISALVLTARLKEAEAAFEDAVKYYLKSEISPTIKLMHYTMRLIYLFFDGDQLNFNRFKAIFRENMGDDILERGYLGAMIQSWNASFEVTRGDHKSALERLSTWRNNEMVAKNQHLKSIYLQWEGLILSLTGKTDEALQCADLSAKSRADIGGEFFASVNKTITAVTRGLTGDLNGVEEELDESREELLRQNQKMMASMAGVCLTWAKLEKKDMAGAKSIIRETLSIARANGYRNFVYCPPEIYLPVFSFAMSEGIERDYILSYLKRYLGKSALPDGKIIPLLDVKVLGGVELSIAGGETLRQEEISKTMRSLLALLVSSPLHGRGQSEIASVLWPDSSEAKARSNFDTLLGRFRKLLKNTFGNDAKNYLCMENSVLTLKHCRIDCVEFMALFEDGVRYYYRKKPLMTAQILLASVENWDWPFLPGAPSNEIIENYRYILFTSFTQATVALTKTLIDMGIRDMATIVASAGFLKAPSDAALAKAAYDAYTFAGDASASRGVINHYKSSLKETGFTEEEIEEAIESFWSV